MKIGDFTYQDSNFGIFNIGFDNAVHKILGSFYKYYSLSENNLSAICRQCHLIL